MDFEFEGEIKVWDVATGTALIALQHDAYASNLAFSPDGSKIVCGSTDTSTIKVWNSDNGDELMTLRGHADLVTSVAFSPDGRRIVSASRDRTAKIWDSQTGDELLTLRNDSGLSFNCVAFAPDGKSIAAGTLEGAIVLWESAEPTEGYPPRQVGKTARKLVDALYQEYDYYYEVLNQLRAEKPVDQAVLKIASQIADSRRGHDTEKLRIESLDVVYSPDKANEDYDQALKKAKMADELDPNNPDILTIVGLAQYRIGAYEEAIETLTRAQKIWESIEDPIDASFAFIAKAMVSHRLGRDENKEEALKRLENLRKEEPIAGIKEAQAFLTEAEKLIEGEKQ